MLTTTPPPALWESDLSVEVAEALSRASGGLAIDIETSGLDWQTDRIASVQLATADGLAHVVRVTGEQPRRIVSLLGDRRVAKVLHHAMFDLRFMAHAWEVPIANVSCTKIASKLLRPADSNHSLKPLLSRYLGVELDKREQRSDWFAPVLSPEQIRYAVGDVIHLHALMAALTDDLEACGLAKLAADCYAHLPTRVALEVGGFPDVFTY